jgi:hypothetical protein
MLIKRNHHDKEIPCFAFNIELERPLLPVPNQVVSEHTIDLKNQCNK